MAKKTTTSKSVDQRAHSLQHPSSVYLRSLSIHNIRCFGTEPQTLQLSTPEGSWAPWTIILGNNGTGKSTLLQLLNCFSINVLSFKEGNSSEFVALLMFEEPTRGDESTFPRAFTTSERMQPYDPDLPLEQHRSIAQFEFHLESRSNSTGVRSKTINAIAGWQGFHPNGWVARFKPDEVRFVQFAYGAWRRLGRSTLTPELERGQKKRVSHLFDETVELLNAEEWLQRLDYSASKPSSIRDELRQQFQLVRAALLDILPDIEDIKISPPSKAHPNPRVLFKTPYGEVQLRQLGFGYQSLISWVVDFAARMIDTYPDSHNPLTEPAICLIDEIDLHLHPTWQRKVMKYLSERFPKTQFIATAHSPLIVQAAPEIGANVAVLHREGDHVVISNNPIDVQGWRADQILSSELFDNQPLRSPQIQSAIDERTRLLAKQKLTTKDHKRLAELDAIVDELPVGSTPDERNIAAQLKAAASLLDRVTSRKS